MQIPGDKELGIFGVFWTKNREFEPWEQGIPGCQVCRSSSTISRERWPPVVIDTSVVRGQPARSLYRRTTIAKIWVAREED
jgi:hypothetical protein